MAQEIREINKEMGENSTESNIPEAAGDLDQRTLVQKKSFTKWINAYLKRHDPPTQEIEDLFEDIRKGVKLICLLEVLSSEKIPYAKVDPSKMNEVHFRDNVSKAFEFLEKKNIPLEGVNRPDIAQGNPKIVLALIWIIISKFQIEKQSEKKTTGDELLEWAQKAVSSCPFHRQFGIEVQNFGKSWRNGYAFNAVLYYINPELVDMSKLPNNGQKRLSIAFNTAEDSLGISKILDPKDVDVEKPDERSIRTYVAMLREYWYAEEEGDSHIAKVKKRVETSSFTHLREPRSMHYRPLGAAVGDLGKTSS